MVGAERSPFCPPIPVETAALSVPLPETSWQVLQDIVPSSDRRGSKKSCFPKFILATELGLSDGSGAISGSGSTRGRSQLKEMCGIELDYRYFGEITWTAMYYGMTNGKL